MKNIFFGIGIMLVACYITSCSKGGDFTGVNGNTYAVTSVITSKQLIPAIDTTTTGTITGIYDEQTNILNCNVAWNDVFRDSIYNALLGKNVVAPKDTLSAIKFYVAASASSIGTLARSFSVVNLNKSGSINLTISGNQCFLPSEEADFIASNWYVVICTNKFPNGLLRGRIQAIKQ